MTTDTTAPNLPEPAGRPMADRDVWANDPEDSSAPPSGLADDDLLDIDVAPKRTSGARAFVDWVVVVTVALLVAFVVRGFVLAHFVVDGSSMFSTLETGDRVFVNKLSYRLHDPNRGDVVVLHQITGASERDLIKRVIALPGETVEMESCVVSITLPGEGPKVLNEESYLDPTIVTPTNCGSNFSPITIPDGHVFVMGDNRGGSQDSRSGSVGPVSFDDLVGRAFVVFWPRANWQWL